MDGGVTGDEPVRNVPSSGGSVGRFICNTSRPGFGSTTTESGDSKYTRRTMAREKSTSSGKLLVADDNHQNCELLDAYLSEAGYQVDMVYDGQQTLDYVRKTPPDLILLDIMMPKVSGYEVCQRLKGDPETEHIPIIMVTALAEMGDIEKAVNAGANDFLTKPVNKLELTTRVKTLLELRHLKNECERLLAYVERVDGMRGEKPAN